MTLEEGEVGQAALKKGFRKEGVLGVLVREARLVKV